MNINRGSTFTVTHVLKGKHDDRKIEIQCKTSVVPLPTDSFIIRKRNTLAGGSDSEISVSYDGSNTTVTAKFTDDDTKELTCRKFYYDIMSTHATNSDDVLYPIEIQSVTLIGTITSPLSGLASSDEVRIVTVDAKNANVGDVATVVDVAGVNMISLEPPAASPIKIYRALMSQSGTNDPTVVILENTIGNIAWTVSPIPGQNGIFWTVASPNTFPQNKTFIRIGSLYNEGYVNTQWSSSANIIIHTYNTSWTHANSILSATPIEILVYP